MPKTKPNKSDFVRSLPPEMPAADVVAKAKEAGMTITKGLVYVVRSSRAGKASGKKAGARRGRRSSGGKPSASEFIRSQAASMSARQVAEEGTKAGYAFKPGLVYTVRRAAEMRARKSGAPAAAKKAAATAAPTAPASTSRSELRSLMIRIGLENFETLSSSLLRELSKG